MRLLAQLRRVGKAKRAHHLHLRIEMVGTSLALLCPPYKSSSPGLTGRPVFQRRQRLSREAAAYWIARSSRATTVGASVGPGSRPGRESSGTRGGWHPTAHSILTHDAAKFLR